MTPEFTIGKRGTTIIPSSNTPSSTKDSDFWIDTDVLSLRLYDSQSASWVVPMLDDIRISDNSISASGTRNDVPGTDRDLVLVASGTAGIVVANGTTTPKIRVADEESLFIKGGDSTNTDAGDLILSAGKSFGSGTDGDLLLQGLTWPNSDGSSGQVLTTDGNGNLTFQNVTSTVNNALDDYTGMTSWTSPGLSVVDEQTVTVSSGEAVFVDSFVQPRTFSNESWADFNITIDNSVEKRGQTYLFMQSGGTVVQSSSFISTERLRDEVFLGTIIHNTSTGDAEAALPQPSVGSLTGYDLYDVGFTINKTIVFGMEVVPNTNLTFKLTSGTGVVPATGYLVNPKNPNIFEFAEVDPAEFTYITSRGVSDVVSPTGTTQVDPTVYEDANGDVVLLPGGNENASIQRLYVVPSAGNALYMLYGQVTHKTVDDARRFYTNDTDQTVVPEWLERNGILVMALILDRRTVNLTELNFTQIVERSYRSNRTKDVEYETSTSRYIEYDDTSDGSNPVSGEPDRFTVPLEINQSYASRDIDGIGKLPDITETESGESILVFTYFPVFGVELETYDETQFMDIAGRQVTRYKFADVSEIKVVNQNGTWYPIIEGYNAGNYANNENYRFEDDESGVLYAGQRYFYSTSDTLTLDSYASMPSGRAITIATKFGVSLTINAATSEFIEIGGVTSSSTTVSGESQATFVYNGTNWTLLT